MILAAATIVLVGFGRVLVPEDVSPVGICQGKQAGKVRRGVVADFESCKGPFHHGCVMT